MLLANLVTILLCSLVFANLLLLGEFFFVFFIAFITSVSLREIRQNLTAALIAAL